MTALAASDIEVTIPPKDRNFAPSSLKCMALAVLTFGDGVKTYPAGGIPAPAIGQFGLKNELQRMIISQPANNGLTFRYDRENHKIMAMAANGTMGSIDGVMAEIPDGTVLPEISIDCIVVGE